MSESKLSSTKQLNKRTSSFFLNFEVVELKNNLIVNDLFSKLKLFYGLKYIRQNRTQL